MRNHKGTLLIAGLVTLTAIAVRHPTVDLRLVTHDVRDPAPHRMQAAVDFGLVGVSVLYTWTVNRLR
ncbi:hypothetical protein C8J44_1014 [Sphingomonas sp. PP-CE-3A-406]|uniref:hypothetical protein n=1 Tax=unclassified Sphingomonas TaxID=196159 RepID=UPI000EF96063|nr:MULTISPECIES: hypothetical protein [unclassified Sphingomonas]RMB28456.1 hypothetical protein C8J47_2676 [Sphingomonas sp. PP-F2F-G114-C0414]RMB55755.1 hypothetical protein C8J44_1014 [Sphingomonas sp. PP-CE-3A-406]